jgi:hypothetical protein
MTVHTVPLLSAALCGVIWTVAVNLDTAAGNFGAQIMIGAVSGMDCAVYVGLFVFPQFQEAVTWLRQLTRRESSASLYGLCDG